MKLSSIGEIHVRTCMNSVVLTKLTRQNLHVSFKGKICPDALKFLYNYVFIILLNSVY